MNREDIIKLAQEIWGKSDWNDAQAGRLERFAALVAEKERDACANVAIEPQFWPLPSFTHQPSDRTVGRIEGEKEMSRRIADAIRARGNK